MPYDSNETWFLDIRIYPKSMEAAIAQIGDAIAEYGVQIMVDLINDPRLSADEVVSRFKVLLDRGVDVNGNMRLCPLTIAANLAALDRARMPIVEWLLQNGADPNRVCRNYHVLYSALTSCGWYVAEVTELLVASGADPNHRNPDGTTVYDDFKSFIEQRRMDRRGRDSAAKADRILIAHGTKPTSDRATRRAEAVRRTRALNDIFA